MDYVPADLDDSRKRRRWLIIGAVAACLVIAIVLWQAMQPSHTTVVDRDSLYIARVKQGTFKILARGLGTLVPEDTRWISSETEGVVERVFVLPGVEVSPDTQLLRLSNRELEQELKNVNRQLISAQAEYENKLVQEEDVILGLEFEMVKLKAELENAELDVTSYGYLFEKGIITERELSIYQIKARQLAKQRDIMSERLTTRRERVEQNMQPYKLVVETERERVDFLKRQIDALSIYAPQSGILQRLEVEEGEQITAGQPLAQVVNPGKLKAVVAIPEYQAKNLSVGLPVSVDTRVGIVSGKLTRIDPVVNERNVNIDIHLEEALPEGVRSDFTVTAEVLIAEIPDTLYVEKPVGVRENQMLRIFVLNEDATLAHKRQVSFGKISSQYVEILEGVSDGDRIILSETGEWTDRNTLQLK